MKPVIMKILMIAAGVGLFALLVVGSLWSDAKSLNTNKNAQITKAAIPSS